MKNRSLYAVLTRFGIIGAVLTAVLLIGSVASAQGVNSEAHEYAENTDIAVPIGTYSAVDPEGEGVEYGVSDEDNFAISADGVLTFKESPDFEAKDEYMVDVLANEEKLIGVTITITNMEEGATVTVSPPRPQVGKMASAELEDMDGGEDDLMWQWSRCSDMTTCADIDGATDATYEVDAADAGMYLQASVSYLDDAENDGDARDMESGMSELKAEASPDANAAPMFDPGEDGVDHDNNPDTANAFRITIKENAEGAIGDPIQASDADNDVRLYSLVEVAPRVEATDGDDNARFEVHERTGQISVTDDTVLNAEDDTDIPNGNNEGEYVVTITATDPSGASGTATVEIVVEDVDEPPVLEDDNATELTIGEADSTDSTVIPAALANAVDTEDLSYDATDSDQDDTDVVWSVSDEDNFTITGDSLTFTGEAPDYETQSEYKVTLTAVGNRTDGSEAKSTLVVTVKVTNVDETGTVMMSARQAQVGNSVKASVEDPDGDTSGVTWSWARTADAVDVENDGCPEAGDPETDSDWDAIEGAESASYTTASDDDGQCLQASATYMDPAEGDPLIAARGVSEMAVETKPAANKAPKFDDEEMPSGADPIEIELDENSTGNVGDEPIMATDGDNDLMLYSLEGDDKDAFDVVERGSGEGQVSVGDGTKLDYESDKTTYSFMVVATDPSGASDSVMVTVTLKGVDEDPVAPEGVTNPKEVDYPENSPITEAVATYAAVDPEGEDVTFSVDDEDNFEITEDGGVLTFKESPDFESMDSYTVIVEANDADLETVTITITNVEEDAEVTMDQPQPQIGRPVIASLEDMDGGEEDLMWQWSRCSDMTTCVAIEGAVDSDYTPDADDVGMYLQASVSYLDDAKNDGDARDMASGMSENKVEGSPADNAAPEFAPDVDPDPDADPATDNNIYRITIPENSEGAIGDPITATDADEGDVRLYSLGAAAEVDNGEFTIAARTGQISVGADTALDYETPLGTGADGNDTEENTYNVTVIATDPSGATGMATVNIVVENADEKPDFGDDDTTELTISEDGDDQGTDPDVGLSAGDGSLTYSADDPDDGETAQFSLSGADKDAFDIDETSGALSLKTGDDAPMVDYETQKEYNITVEAKGTADSTAVATLKVKVTVANVDESGMVTLDTRQPQVGNAVMASVMDPDGGVDDLTWQWYSLISDTPTEPNGVCPAADDGRWAVITDATAAAYTPVADDATYCLRATPMYMDAAEAETEDFREVHGVTQRAVEVKPAANKKPAFTDDEMPDGADPIEIELDENSEGNFGDPITASDGDLDLLMYTLVGDDADAFDVVEMGGDEGQLSVGDDTKLDYEGQKVYSFMVKATDPSGAYDAVMVTVTLEDVDEPPKLNSPPEFDGEMAERSVAENSAAGTDVGDPITATDENTGDSLTYSLDDMHFDIDDMGQITVGEGAMLDHETMASHTVTVTATDTGRLYAMIVVTITVTDVNEAPAFASDMVTINVLENTAAGENIGDPIAATDEDEGATLEYSLGGDDAASFAIDAATGQLMTMAALDHETKSSYTVTVMVTDGELSAEITVMVTVDVDNVNEAPVFDEGESADRNVDENTEAGENIGDPVTATDEDAGDTLTYSLDEMGDMSFDIDPATGQLMTEAALDYESGTTSYSVTVTATDSDGLTDTIAVTIAVNDVAETPVFDADAIEFPVDENMAVGAEVGTVTAIHAESYSDDLDYFDVDDMGNITTAMMFDYEGGDTSFTGTVTATGADGSTDTIAVTVTVGDAHPDCTVMDNMGLTNDCEALLDAKGDLGGDLNWDADTAMADWEGVTMSDGRVSGIWLRDEGLDGSVSAALGRLDMLTVLNLHTNSLSGEIPDLSGASMLEELYLPNNDADGWNTCSG